MKKTQWILLALLLSQTGCFLQKDDPKPGSDVAGLPAATQTGANTFGCLVNGKPWTPTGKTSFFSKNLDLEVDPSFRGGFARINAYRYIKGIEDTVIGFTIDSLPKYKENIYQLLCIKNGVYTSGGGVGINFNNICKYECGEPENSIVKAECKVTKFDLKAQIYSGTFEFTLVKKGCDTIKITKGRFDLKF